MDTGEKLRKSNLRHSKLPTCSFEIAYFKRLFNIIQEVNKEAINLAISDLRKNPDQTDEDFNNLKDYVASIYRVQVQVLGSKGEYQLSDSEVIFDDATLPDNITRVIIDNASFFKMRTNMEPQYKVIIEFDFSTPNVIDFTTNPSFATENNSYMQVYGIKETWVNGAYESIMNSLKENKTNRGWIHGKSIYDVILWFVFLPLVFWNLYKLESFFSKCLINISNVLLVVIYIYVIVAILYIFRMLFDYTRWMFPYLELEGRSKKGSKRHKGIWLAVFGGIFITQIKDLVLYLFKILF